MKYPQFVVVCAALLTTACASATKRGGGNGDVRDMSLGPFVEELDLSEPPDLTRVADRDLGGTGLVGADLAGLDLASAPSTMDLAGPRDLAGSSPSDLGGLPANLGDTCATAPLLPTGVDVPNQDTTGLADDYDIGTSPSSACSVFAPYVYDGPDGAYRVVIPAGKTLTVNMVKSNLPTTWDPALAIVTNCASIGPSCLSGSDNVTGLTETVTYTNASGSPLTVYVIVEAYNPDQFGKFAIRADLN